MFDSGSDPLVSKYYPKGVNIINRPTLHDYVNPWAWEYFSRYWDANAAITPEDFHRDEGKFDIRGYGINPPLLGRLVLTRYVKTLADEDDEVVETETRLSIEVA